MKEKETGGEECSVGAVVCVVVRSSQVRDQVERVRVEDLQLILDYQEGVSFCWVLGV